MADADFQARLLQRLRHLDALADGGRVNNPTLFPTLRDELEDALDAVPVTDLALDRVGNVRAVERARGDDGWLLEVQGLDESGAVEVRDGRNHRDNGDPGERATEGVELSEGWT